MYVAKYDLGTQPLYQIVACLPNIVVSDGDESWARGYQAFIESLLDADASFSYRIASSGSSLVRHFFASSQNRAVVMDLAAMLDGLNTVVEHSVLRPDSSAEHDRFAARFPPIRRNVGQQRFFAAGFEIPVDFHVLSCAARLLRLAISSQNDFGMQVNTRRFSPSPEDLRNLRKRLADLRYAGSIPDKLLAQLSRQIEDLPNRTHLVDEYVGAASTIAMNSAATTLETAFNQQQTGLGLSGSPVEGKGVNEEIETGLGSWFFDETQARLRMWKSATRASLLRWFESPSEKELARLGATNVVKESIGTVDMLVGISSKLDEIERKLAGLAATEPADLRAAIRIADTDYRAAAIKARSVIEQIVTQALASLRPAEAKKPPPLVDMIERLKALGAVPQTVYSYMHLVRTIGNKGAHPGEETVTRTDLETCIMAAFRVVEWFFLERRAATTQP